MNNYIFLCNLFFKKKSKSRSEEPEETGHLLETDVKTSEDSAGTPEVTQRDDNEVTKGNIYKRSSIWKYYVKTDHHHRGYSGYRG